MVMMLVYLIMAIGLLGSVGYSVFTFQRSAEMVALAGRNSAHVEAMVSLLRGSMRYNPVTHLYMAPLGDPDVTGPYRMRLPGWVVGDDHTPWGARYGWCPMSTSGPSGSDPSATVVSSSLEGSYQVSEDVVTDDRGRPHTFVSGMSWAAAPSLGSEVVGVLVSPLPMSTMTPDCADVVLSNGYYVIAPKATIGGTVSPVTTAGLVLTTTLSQVADPFVYVAPDGSATGDGSDPSKPMPFAQALGYWHQVAPKGLTMNLAAGSYALPGPQKDGTDPADLSFDESGVPAANLSASRAYLALRGPSTGTATIAAASGQVDLYLGVNVQVDGNVALDPSLTTHVMPHVQASLSLTSVGPVSVEGGDLTLTTGPVSTLSVIGGSANVTAVSVSQATLSGGTMTLMTGQEDGLSVTSGSANVTSTSLTQAILSGGTTNLSTGALGTLQVTGGIQTATASSVTNVSMLAGDAHLALTGSVSGASLRVGGGRLRLSSSSSLSAAPTLTGGSLALDGIALTASSTPTVTSPGTSITLANGAKLAYGSTTFATPAAFYDSFAGVTDPVVVTSCPMDGTRCLASCTTVEPYLVGGECSLANARTVFMGAGQLTAKDETGVTYPVWSCQFAATMTTTTSTNASGQVVTQSVPAPDAAGSSTARCSSVQH